MAMSIRAATIQACCAAALFTAVPAPGVAATNVVCSPFVRYTRLVGDTAADKDCTDDDIQSAIDHIICPNTTIYVVETPDHHYTAEHLLIQDLSLTILGSSASTCSQAVGTQGAATPGPDATAAAPAVTISGSGHSGDSVVSIHGNSNVTLQSVVISGGRSDKNQFGGGIYFGGQGSLTLNTTNVTDNFAGYGGGINVIAEGGDVAVTLNHAQIALNTAQYNGGGIRIEGYTHLYMLDTGSSIALNHTIGPDATDPNGGHGGGIVAFGPAVADLASPAALLSNSAQFGGGMAVLATSSGDATVRLFGVNGSTAGVLENTASVIGGAAFIHSTATGGQATAATLCAHDFRIDGNQAPNGAALYADGETDGSLGSYLSSVYLNSNTNCGVTPTIASLGASTCSTQPCDELSNNSAVDAQLQPTGGAIIAFNRPGFFDFNRFAMRGNSAGQLISVLNTNVPFENVPMNNCLLADNHTQHELVHEDHADLAISNCTFANNTIDDGYVFFADHGFTLTDSIVWEPGRLSVDYLADDCVGCEVYQSLLSNDISTFIGGLGLVQTDDPLFVDADNANPDLRDYHLVAYAQDGQVTASQAIDAAQPLGDGDHDLDGKPHDIDVPTVGSDVLVRDLGAYEAQPVTDRVFADAFGDRVSLLQ